MLVTSSWPNDTKSVHGGAPAGCTLLKLIDVPELNYYSNEGKGEIMVKGPHVTKGYFKVWINRIIKILFEYLKIILVGKIIERNEYLI